MPLKFFTIPVANASNAEDELNSFLASHSVLAVERHWVDEGLNSFWAICVDYRLTVPKSTSDAMRSQGKSKVDYRVLLPPDQFLVFSKLRDLRKEIAQQEAIPVYTIFTNEQLAEMVRRKISSVADLESIIGVGDSRSSKYGERFVTAISSLLVSNS